MLKINIGVEVAPLLENRIPCSVKTVMKWSYRGREVSLYEMGQEGVV